MMRTTSVLVTLLAAIAATAAPSVKASITQRAGPNLGEYVLTLRLQAIDMKLGSYQGTMRYTPGSLTIVSAMAPKGDGTRVVNVADSAKGIVRIAGFTVSGFTTQDALTLVVRTTGTLEAANLSAELQVAGDLNGVAVPKDRLLPARGTSAETGRD